jgi:WD40 repeat protein
MSTRRKWKSVAVGFLPLALLAVLLSRTDCSGKKPGAADGPARTLTGHRSPVQALAFGPDGNTLTSVAYRLGPVEHAVELLAWDVPTGRLRTTHTAFQSRLGALALSAGGGTVATTGAGGTVRLWDTVALAPRVPLGEGLAEVCALAFSADGTVLAAADHEKRVTLWERFGRRRWVGCNGPVSAAFVLAFAPDGRSLAGGGFDPDVRLWDTATGAERGALGGHALGVVAVAFAPDGRMLASGDLRGAVRLWDVATRTERATLRTAADEDTLNEVTAVAFAPDGRTLAVAVGREVQLWDVAAGHLVARLEGHAGKVKCLAYAPDGTRLASGGYDQTVRLWDVGRCP